MLRPPAYHRAGFSLVEALVSITIMSIVGGAIMLAMGSAADTTNFAVESTIAAGIARQVVDEVVGTRYAAAGAGPYQTTLIASGWERDGNGRERFDDTDDYHNFAAQPVEGIYGYELGRGDDDGGLRPVNFGLPAGFFSAWRQEIEVYYVDADDHSVRLSGSNTSDFRAVEVVIWRDNPDATRRELARVRRVYAYVPTP